MYVPRFFRPLCWLPVAILLAGLAGCQQNGNKPPPPKPAEVTVGEVRKQEITDFEDFTGTLEAYRKVDIQSRVTGYLMKVNFQEGARVKKDQVLFEIDPRPYQAELDKAEATVGQSRARLNRLEGDLSRAQ